MDDQQTREAAADLIDDAIDVLHERGWCQGAVKNAAGQVCVEGALGRAAVDKTIAAHESAMAAVTHTVGMSAWRFNDQPDTTVEDVLLGMKRAAASLREVV